MSDQAVFITGATGGIAAAVIPALTDRGFRVYAGVRRDAPELAAQPGVEVVHCDVTDPDDVAAAARLVSERQGGRGIQALINNAGFIVQGPQEAVPVESWRAQFDVNVTGVGLVTREFLPLLRQGGGRILNLSAVSGRVPFPFLGVLSASKAALESISGSLRIELKPWGIPVIVIEPGAMQTEIFAKAAARAASMSSDRTGLYQRQADVIGAALADQKLGSPSVVAEVIVRAVEAQRPRRRYSAGSDARMAGVLAHLPIRLREPVITRYLGLHKV
jgi:NAD(P)-dependent dehydrogenase (short-subunit alcohol dehydrogenase family)